MTACSRYRPRWHASPRSQADVTVIPFPWLRRVTLIFPCVLNTPFVYSLFLLFLSVARWSVSSTEKPAALIQLVRSVFFFFDEIGVLQACAWLVLSRTCTFVQVRSCVKDACFLLPFRPCCGGPYVVCLRDVFSHSCDRVLAQVRSKRILTGRRLPSFQTS